MDEDATTDAVEDTDAETVAALATTAAADALRLLLRLEDEIGAFAGGGRLLTKGLLLSRSARR